LGSAWQVRELGDHPGLILLGVGLGVGAIIAHGAERLFGQPLTLAVLSAPSSESRLPQQLWEPSNICSRRGEASALMLGALLTIAATSVAGMVAARRQSADESSSAAG
jgi:hypothetical protein